MPSTSTTAHNAKGNLASKAGVSYTYADTAHKHAVTALSNGNTYTYDANGNQVTRTVGSVTHTLTYDAENRLTKVMNGATTIATFVYDGDGQRVKSTLNGVTTSFVGNYYEKTGKNSTKYYYAGTARVAMRNTSVKYLFGDQLGSTSVTTSSSGVIGSQARYKPFGEMYYSSGTLPTKYTFTGQYSYANTNEIGLLYYGARFYDPSLGRFASADTIIPGAGNPQSWDRFAYVNNNPLRYTDPSGHTQACAQGDDCHYNKTLSVNDYIYVILKEYGSSLAIPQNWTLEQVKTVFRSYVQMENGLDRITGGKGKDWINGNLAGTILILYNDFGKEIGSFVLGRIVFLPSDFNTSSWFNSIDHTIESMIAHELGHVWDNNSRKGLGDATFFGGGYGDALNQFMGGDPTGLRWKGHVNIPRPNQFPPDQGPGYGNTSSADYFAHAFIGTIISSNDVPQQAKMWMAVVIDLTK